MHIVANVLYIVWKGENLVIPMFTGRKRRAAFEDAQEVRIAPTWLAVACLAAAIVIVLGGIRLAGGKPF